MQPRPDAMDDYASAVASEQAAWAAVRHRLPGTANFNQDLWLRWRTCVEEADRAAGRANSRYGAPQAVAGAVGREPGRWPPAIRLPPIFSRRPKV